MKNTGNTKFIFLHPYIQNQTVPNRLWIAMAFISFLTLTLILILINFTQKPYTPATQNLSVKISATHLPKPVISALLHYASDNNTGARMSHEEVKAVSDAILECSRQCNFLVFGLTAETLLWRALNHAGRTVFVEENRYYAAFFEEKHPEVDVYDVHFATKVRDLQELVAETRERIRDECRPIQNLLFSECRLGLNDLPNNVYEVEWDVILVDGPRGYWPDAPGRMASIFTAGVLARSKKGNVKKTHVFVHDYETEVEKVCSHEFLCAENLVQVVKGSLAHFSLRAGEVAGDNNGFEFCRNRTSSNLTKS